MDPNERRQDAAGRHAPVANATPDTASRPLPDGLEEVLESAARLQELVPDAVLVGGSAVSYYARHRMSTDHDHILSDLQGRFESVLDALESDGEWVLNRTTPGKIILGELGGIEAGVRQMIRTRPLEAQRVTLPSGKVITVPTVEEIARIKGYLVVKRNQMRDYLDLAALSHKFGPSRIGQTLRVIDDYYADDTHPEDHPVQSQLARQLADPLPKDRTRTRDLHLYKNLERRWHDWANVVADCQELAVHVMG